MPEPNNTCQVEMRSGICGREIVEDGKCICHLDCEVKDEQFQIELDKVFGDKNSDCFELTSFVFPRAGYTLNYGDPKFEKDLSCRHATFLGSVDFRGAQFTGRVDFCYASFAANADFNHAEFAAESEFFETKFLGEANFSGAKFSGDDDVLFLEAKFSGKADFSDAMFSGTTTFAHATFLSTDDAVSFRDAKFSNTASFSKAEFLGETSFFAVLFSAEASFAGTKFQRKVHSVDFIFARFMGKAEFTGAIFAADANFFQVPFSGVADFSEATFSGLVNFGSCEFSGKLVFYRTKFLGNDARVMFETALFSGEVYFGDVHFSGDAYFSHITVAKEVVFEDSSFAKVSFAFAKIEKEAVLLFDSVNREVMFEDEADMSSITFQGNALIKFRKVNLDKCSFLETDLTRVEFVDVDWPKYKGPRRNSRKCVYDELRLRNDSPADKPYKLIAQLYRRLQKNYIDNFNYAEAGDFYIGEQEMIRKDKGKYRQHLCWNNLYKKISLYGESYRRPFFCLMFVLLFVPLILLYTGINLPTDSSSIEDGVVKIEFDMANYQWSNSPLDFFIFKKDYWKSVYGNITFMMLGKANVDRYLIQWWQKFAVVFEMLLVYVLMTFFLLALRRPYRRKSF